MSVEGPADDPEGAEQAARHLRSVPHARALGLELASWSAEACTVRVPWAGHLVGDPDTGVLHGGVLTATLDNVMGISVHAGSLRGASRAIATLDLRIDYMRPAEPGRDLLARAECFRRTTNVAFARAVAYHDDPAEPVATAVAAFMLGTPNRRRES